MHWAALFSVLTVVAVNVLTDVPPLVDHMEAGLQTELALSRSLPPHEAVHAVVVQLLVLVQEGVVHGQLLLLVVVPPGEVVPVPVGPVIPGVGEPPVGDKPGQAGRSRLHNKIVSDGSVLRRKYL